MLPHENSKDKVEKYIVQIDDRIEEVIACSMKFAVKDWFCLSFFDVNGRMVKEYFKVVNSVTPIYSVEE
jgi:metal-responsive CopG/Arc/MetJ family transcriptional regulator